MADPLPAGRLCGAWTLAMEDRVATKLMANSDRWADDGVMSGDLIEGRLATCIRKLQITMTADSLRARIIALRTSGAPVQVTPERRRKGTGA